MDLLCYYGLSNSNIKINYCDNLIVLKYKTFITQLEQDEMHNINGHYV